MTAAAGTDPAQRPRHCANHPRVETLVSCSNCGKPICPDCMVPAPVGIKCRDCAKQPRSARVLLKPSTAAKAGAAALAVGSGFGVVLALVGSSGIGFFTFVIAYFVGLMTGRAVLAASGRYRAPAVAWIAAAGAAWAYVVPAIVIAIATGGAVRIGLQGLGILIAGFFAHREVIG